jgi:predicted MFS family arabinose efflux permease
VLYEAALGLGIATGPLLGGFLGAISWRGPFFGAAALMAIGFVAVAILLERTPKPERHESILEPIRALGHGGLRTMSITAVLYNFGFFTLLAYTPFPLHLDAHGLGYVFAGWGVLVAITSVFLAPRLSARFGTLKTMYVVLVLIAADLLVMGLATGSQLTLIVMVVVAGAFLGVNNTLVTTAVMKVAPVERPVASASYSFVRFTGGAVAPYLAGKLASAFSPHVPFFVGSGAVLLALVALIVGRNSVAGVDGDSAAAAAPGEAGETIEPTEPVGTAAQST